MIISEVNTYNVFRYFSNQLGKVLVYSDILLSKRAKIKSDFFSLCKALNFFHYFSNNLCKSLFFSEILLSIRLSNIRHSTYKIGVRTGEITTYDNPDLSCFPVIFQRRM